MATFQKGILGGFSGKVGNVVGYRWRGRDVMRSLPQRGNYTPTPEQVLQQQKFSLVIGFVSPIKAFLSVFFGQPQGDRSRFNLATSYHLREAVLDTPQGFAMDYPKVLISKGDLLGLEAVTATAAANQVVNLSWTDNSGQSNSEATDLLTVMAYNSDLDRFEVFQAIAERSDTSAAVTLPANWATLDVQVWATFTSVDLKKAATSSYLGNLTVQ